MPIRFSAFGRVFSPSWLMTLLTIVFAAGFAGLGRWQWQRGVEKQVVWAEYERNAPTEDLGARDLDTLERFARVRITGEFRAEHQFLLDNRSHDGRPGYEVLTQFDFGERRVLVNRGWVPFTGYRDRLPDVTMAGTGPVTISGRIEELPAEGLASGHAAPELDASWPKVTSFPTRDELATALGLDLPQRILLLDADAPGGYVRAWTPPGLPPARHFSYAIQWWGFAIVLLVLYFGLNFRKVK